MAIENEYEDVLQNLECGIVQVYRHNRSLLDSDVSDALEAGVFIETASATIPTSLRLHNHLAITVPARVTCIFMDLK
jgi:hypothetical protein